MQVAMQAALTGVKKGKGNSNIEGKDVNWDYTAFYLMVDLPAKGGNAVGKASQEFRFGKSDEFAKWEKIPFPVMVDCKMAITTNGKGDQAFELQEILPSKDERARVVPKA